MLYWAQHGHYCLWPRGVPAALSPAQQSPCLDRGSDKPALECLPGTVLEDCRRTRSGLWVAGFGVDDVAFMASSESLGILMPNSSDRYEDWMRWYPLQNHIVSQWRGVVVKMIGMSTHPVVTLSEEELSTK